MLVRHRTIWMEDGNVAQYALPTAYLCSHCRVITLVKSGAHRGPRNCPNCKTPGKK